MKYPDFKLYEEIIFLQHRFRGWWIVENVIPWYKPLIPGQERHRHMYWSNYRLPMVDRPADNLREKQIPELEQDYGLNLSRFYLPNKRQALRNMVNPHDALAFLQAIPA